MRCPRARDRQPHLAVTFLPLGCSGATIKMGFSKPARTRVPNGTGAACSGTARAQISELTDLMTTARYRADAVSTWCCSASRPTTSSFPGLIASVIIEPGTERNLLNRGGILASVQDAQGPRPRAARQFCQAACRAQADGRGNLSRVVYVVMAIALAGPDTPCPGGRDGFDVHPAFAADGERLRQAAEFVSENFCPASRPSHAAKKARRAVIPRPSA